MLAWPCVLALLFSPATSGAAPPQADSAHQPRRSDGSPRSEWEITFEDGISADEYARQLDFFKIEVAAAAKDGSIDYIWDLLKRKPQKRAGSNKTDYRVYIGWRKGNLYAADRRLLTRAGVSSEGKELRHYLPTAVEAQLAALERDYAGREVTQIRRTRFALRPNDKGDGYEFVVIEQDPPRPTSPRPRNSENQPRETTMP